jgi:hypothetical protein
MEVPNRPSPDHVYRRFSARDWYKFFFELTDETVIHTTDPQECPFCNTPQALEIETARKLRPPHFKCRQCDREGDVLEFIAEYNDYRLERRTDALDYLAKWAVDHDLPDVFFSPPNNPPTDMASLGIDPAVVLPFVPKVNGADTDPRRFKILRIHDFLNAPPISALIADVLPSGQVSVLFGESNSFKSFLAIDMLCSIATGRDWHGHGVEEGPVLYCVTEGAHNAVAKRIVGWFEDKGLPLDLGNLMIGIIKVPVILNRPADVDALIATIAEQLPGCKLAVFDLQAGSMEGSENDPAIATAWVRGTQRLADELTCTQLHVTHSGYSDPSRARGSSHLWGSFSTRLKAEGNQEARTTYLAVERHKDWNDAGLGWSFDLAVIPVGNEHETTLVPRLQGGPQVEAKLKKNRKNPPKPLRMLRQSLDAVIDGGSMIRPFVDGPLIKAVNLETVRAEFIKRYPVGEGTEEQKYDTRRKAWTAAIKHATDAMNGEVGFREIDQVEWLWPI